MYSFTIELIEYFRLNNWTIEYNQNLWNPKVELTQLFCHYSECRSTQMFTSSQHNEFWPKLRTAFKTCNVRPRWQTRAQSLPWGESMFVPKKTRRKKTERKTTNSKRVLLIENNNNKGGELEMGKRWKMKIYQCSPWKGVNFDKADFHPRILKFYIMISTPSDCYKT